MLDFQKIKWQLINRLEQMPLLQLSPPGFDDKSIFEVFSFFNKTLVKGAINIRAAAVSFKFFLAIFPAIIFLFTLIPFLLKYIPFLPDQDYVSFIMHELEILLPKSAFEVSKETIYDILSIKRSGLLSITFFLTLYFSTGGFYALIEAFNYSINIKEKASSIKQRGFAVLLMFIILFLTVFTIALTIFSDLAFDYLLTHNILQKGIMYYVILVIDFLFIVALIYFSVSFMYFFAPSDQKRWRFFSAGSSLSTILICLVSYGFSWYINHFSNYNKLYGSIGTLIVIMLWMNIISTILIIGFELNASIESALKEESQT